MNEESGVLGTAPVRGLYLKLAIPSVIAQIVNLLYNIVDRIFIGHIPGAGTAALTGVGLFVPILTLLNAFAMLAGAGGAPLMAIELGRGNKDKAEKIVGNAFHLLVWFTIILTALLLLLTEPLLRMFGASDVTLPYAAGYARICIWGSVVVLLMQGMMPFMISQGLQRISMIITMVCACINLVLDPIFIFVFGWGANGAAIATVLSQLVGSIWILYYLSAKTEVRLKKSCFRFERGIVVPCLQLGVSSFVMVSTEALLSIAFNSSLAKYGGDLAVGAMAVITSVAQLMSRPMNGFCQGGQPIISFNYGAGNMQRVKQGFRIQFIACVSYAFAFWLIVKVFPRQIVSIFTADETLIAYTVSMLQLYAACFFTVGFQNSCQQGFMALGQAKVSLCMALLRKVILLIPLIYLLPMLMQDKIYAVVLAEPVSDLISAVVTTAAFLTVFFRLTRESGS